MTNGGKIRIGVVGLKFGRSFAPIYQKHPDAGDVSVNAASAKSPTLRAICLIAALLPISGWAQSPTPILDYEFDEGGGSTCVNAGSAGTVANLTYYNAQGMASNAHSLPGMGISTSATSMPTGSCFDNTNARSLRGSTGIGLGNEGGVAAASGVIPDIEGLQSFTIITWIYRASSSNGNSASIYYDQSQTGNGIDYRLGNAQLGIGVNGLPEVYSAAGSLLDVTDRWIFIAVTFNGAQPSNNVCFYRGTLASGTLSAIGTATLSASAVVPSTTGPLVGNAVDNGPSTTLAVSRPLNAYLDAFRLYGTKTGGAGALGYSQLNAIFQNDVAYTLPAALPGPQPLINNGSYGNDISLLPSLLRNFTCPPDNPTPPGDIYQYPPIVSSTLAPPAGAPQIAAFTRQGVANDALYFSGNNIENARVWFYCQTTSSNGEFHQAELLDADSNIIAAALPPAIPNAEITAWIQNGSGPSYPVRVNATEDWWLGPYHALAGATTSVYGRNLSLSGTSATSCYVYVRPWGSGSASPSIPCTVNEANPYKVTFSLPSTIAGGSNYEVWMHNGHGGQYGWSGPSKLYVDASEPYAWTSGTINVTGTAYAGGAKGDGIHDDTAAIQAALNAANNGNVIFFPAGTYLISQSLSASKALKLCGSGTGSAMIESSGSGTVSNYMLATTSGTTEISDITFNCRETNTLQDGVFFFNAWGINPAPTGIIINNSLFETASNTDTVCISILYANDIAINNNTFIAGRAFWLVKDMNARAYGNVAYGNATVLSDEICGNAYAMWTCMNVDYDSNIATSCDWPVLNFRRAFVGDAPYGPNINIYYGLNESGSFNGCLPNQIYCGPTPEQSEQNSGENLLHEITNGSDSTYLQGYPALVSGNTLQFANAAWTPNDLVTNIGGWLNDSALDCRAVYVIAGPGNGQWRRIVTNGTNSVTIDHPWDADVTTSSLVGIQTFDAQMAIYGNSLTGIPDWATRTTSASSGIQMWGTVLDTVIDSNQTNDFVHGIGLWGLWLPQSANVEHSEYGDIVENNTVTNSYTGIIMPSYVQPGGTGTPTGQGPLVVGNVARRNTVSNSTFYGLGSDQPQAGLLWEWAWTTHNLFEHNTVTDAAIGMNFGTQEASNMARENTFNLSLLTSGTGIYYNTGLDDNGDELVYSNVFGANIEATFPPSSFTTWEAASFTEAQLNMPAISGTLANPSGDGICNLLDYAFGLNPEVNNSLVAMPQVTETPLGALALIYRLNKFAADLAYTVQVSSDLQSWSSGSAFTSEPAILSDDGTVQTIQVIDLTSSMTGTQHFMRLVVRKF